MDITLSFPDHEQVINVLNSKLNSADFEAIINAGAFHALESVRNVLRSHVRTGETLESVTTWKITDTPQVLSIAVGSQTRGQILKWLNNGRGPVRPKNKKCLRWLTFPDQIVVFAKYARATKPLKFMEPAGETALNKAAEEATKLLQ
jgi:hypothetical protein